MKTLVLHPMDKSTDFLKITYERHLNDWTIINDFTQITKKDLFELVKNHERIIMMGHGLPYGLMNPQFAKGFGGLLVNEELVPLLKEKDTVSIWCWSDQFFKRHNLKGFHTGMIISEVGEARYVLNETPLNREETLANMVRFATAIRDCIDNTDPYEMQKYVLEHYTGEDKVTQFNRKNIIVLE